MPERRDYLPVCNDQGIALNEFQQTVCVRCVQPECSRSRAGGAFESRVATWKERLFEHPDRMKRDDPRYPSIAAKHFMDIDVGRSSGRGGGEWLDPHAVEEPAAPEEKPRRARATAPRAADASSPRPAPAPQSRGTLNTPFQQGTMLEGPAPAQPPKPVDPWAASVTPTTTPTPMNLVKPGARIKFT